MRIFLFSFLTVLFISGCSKTPESETAKKIGEQPKQLVDRAASDVGKAMQKEEQRQREAEKKE